MIRRDRGGRGRSGAGPRAPSRALLVAALATLPATPLPGAGQAPSGVSPDGATRISFPLRADVELCPGGGGWVHRAHGDVRVRVGREGSCGSGEGTAEIEMEGGRLRALRLRAGSRGSRGDAARLSGPEAADVFLALARNARSGEAGEDAVVAAVVARDAVVWPVLLDLARSDAVGRQTRRSAVFWLGQRAAEAAPDLEALARADDEDREVRKAAVFALSQLDDGGGTDALMRVARSDTDPEVRRAAFFWLAQGADDDVLAFFEEVLRGGR